jgi:UDPglucose--hexose-1-phosphate uridylyltransferase
MSVIRLNSRDTGALIDLADEILSAWRTYTDESAEIYAETDGEPHNTITPIARRRGEEYELDLVLRNNLTTDEHPLGVYHPHAERHNIKKENIGLIEVMGLAILPARLKDEMARMKRAILTDTDFAEIDAIAKHKEWFDSFKDKYTFTAQNTEDILKAEIGNTFVEVLCDAGVYKDTAEGRAAFMRFIESIK